MLFISGYGDTYDEDEDDDQYDLESMEDPTADTQNEDENNIYKDMTRPRFDPCCLSLHNHKLIKNCLPSSEKQGRLLA